MLNIFANGTKVDIKHPCDAVSCGIGYLSEDRKRFGLAINMSVANNIVLATLDDYVNMGIINDSKNSFSVDISMER